MRSVILILAAIVFVVTGCQKSPNQTDMKAPIADKDPKELTIHDHTRVDDYFWLRERENQKVIDYLNAENDYTKAVMKDTEELQENLYQEIIGRIKQTDESVPYKKNGYFYYTRYEEGKEYPIFCRKEGSMEDTEEILLNVNEMAEGHSFYQVAGYSVSLDNSKIAFGVDTVSRRKYTIYFKDLASGQIMDETIPLTTGSAVWAADNKTLFYTRKDEVTLRSDRIYKHILGTPSDKDKEIYHEADETFSSVVYKSKSEKYIMIGCFSTLSSEYRFIPADKPDAAFTIVHPRESDLEYSIDHYKDKFYIVTNYKARNFRLMETSVKDTGKDNWKEIIPHREDVYLRGIEIFKDQLVVSERKDGLTELRVIKWEDWSEHYLDFGEEVYVASVGTNPEFDTDILRFSYSSLTTPGSVFDYNMNSRERELKKQQEVVGDFDSTNYEAKRFYAPAGDGVKVPISLVYRKGLKLDGKAPLLLYAYGSYGYTRDPGFSSVRLSLLDRGFVYAIAHVRGGQIYGRQWYEDGKLFKKKNTFTDFIDCGKYLVEENYTNPETLFAMGGSAGGLLMGAIANMQPDLFGGIIAAVPFVDVVTTMLDDDL